MEWFSEKRKKLFALLDKKSKKILNNIHHYAGFSPKYNIQMSNTTSKPKLVYYHELNDVLE